MSQKSYVKMASSNGWSVAVFLLVAVQLVLCPDQSSALSYEELVRDVDPIIPHEVRMAGNVTVARGTNGMYGQVFISI